MKLRICFFTFKCRNPAVDEWSSRQLQVLVLLGGRRFEPYRQEDGFYRFILEGYLGSDLIICDKSVILTLESSVDQKRNHYYIILSYRYVTSS